MIDDTERKTRTLRPLLSEILRPRALSELILPMQTIHGLQRVLESGSMANMLFYGPPGTGKTSAARIFMNAVGGWLTINHSSKTTPDLVKHIKHGLIEGRQEICFVDEAHFVSKRNQLALADLIDSFSGKRRFLFAATNIAKLTQEFRSRLKEISFGIPAEDRKEVQKRLMERYEDTLSENGFTFDKLRLEQIIEENYPDLRAIANRMEFQFG
jgi:replication-associated recombination protein RarA